LKEREAAYRAARERIFSGDDAKGNDRSHMKCRQAPVVAQRMIAHALGQKVQNTTETVASTESRGKQLSNGKNIPTHSRNNFCPVTPDNREAVRNGSQTQLVVTRIKLHQTKGATQLILELLLLKA